MENLNEKPTCFALQALQQRYPYHRFYMDEEAVIHFSFQDMDITDPFSSECSRFQVSPWHYGMHLSDALMMFHHNEPLGATHADLGSMA